MQDTNTFLEGRILPFVAHEGSVANRRRSSKDETVCTSSRKLSKLTKLRGNHHFQYPTLFLRFSIVTTYILQDTICTKSVGWELCKSKRKKCALSDVFASTFLFLFYSYTILLVLYKVVHYKHGWLMQLSGWGVGIRFQLLVCVFRCRYPVVLRPNS